MTVATASGVRIAYELRGAGEPLLLVHGLGYARWGWEPVANLLAERFLVCLFDNRGIGESEVPKGPYSAADMASDAVAVLDEAEIERAHVLGTSLGGVIAQELALERPERLDRLVLACTTPGLRGHPMPEETIRVLAAMPTLPLEQAFRLGIENALAPGADPELVERILAHRLGSPFDIRGWQSQAAAAMTFDALDRLGEIRAPTLVLHGTEDVVVDPRNSELLAERIPGARLELFEGTGHLFMWEQPERFVHVVGEFLS